MKVKIFVSELDENSYSDDSKIIEKEMNKFLKKHPNISIDSVKHINVADESIWVFIYYTDGVSIN